MANFDAEKKHLTYLLDQIEQRDLALPEFQRSFVWKPPETRELVRSVFQAFPAGTILLLQGGAKTFQPRAFEQAPELDGKQPTYLALDGQQRLTSLSLAFNGRGDHVYFLVVDHLLSGRGIDEALQLTHRRYARTWSSVEGQAKELVLPLSRLRDFANWRDEIIDELERTKSDRDVRLVRRQLNEVERNWITPVLQYQFPVTTLASNTDLEAVCTIFETLNRTGQKLSVFDLLVARGYAQGVELRQLRKDAWETNPLLAEFGVDPYYVLQVIATWVKGNPVRGNVLALDVKDEVEPSWAAAASYLNESLKLLQSECGVLTAKYLPYSTMLLTMAAAWPAIASAVGPEVGARRDKLKRWFWCATFARRYATQGNSRTATDVPELRAWLESDGAVPVVVAEPDRPALRTIVSSNDALYGAILALSLRKHPLDFHLGKPLTPERVRADQIEDHHIFPKAYLGEAVSKSEKDCILNRTLIDAATNNRIRAKSPSEYLSIMAASLGDELLTSVLRSHTLPAEREQYLFTNDFEGFRNWRERELNAAIGEVTGWPTDGARAEG